MELLQIIARVAAVRHLSQTAHLARAVAPPLDRVQVGEEIGGATQCVKWAAEFIRRGQVIPCRDMAPILPDQPPEIAEDATLVGHGSSAQRLRQRYRTGKACCQELLAKEPGYSRGLLRLEEELVENRRHRHSTYSASARLQGASK